jgi:hypothetical protein
MKLKEFWNDIIKLDETLRLKITERLKVENPTRSFDSDTLLLIGQLEALNAISDLLIKYKVLP